MEPRRIYDYRSPHCQPHCTAASDPGYRSLRAFLLVKRQGAMDHLRKPWPHETHARERSRNRRERSDVPHSARPMSLFKIGQSQAKVLLFTGVIAHSAKRYTLGVSFVVGSVAAGALNAAAAFAVTVGIGEAACVWLGYRRRGLIAPDNEVRRAFADGLAAGLRYGKRRAAQLSLYSIPGPWPVPVTDIS